MSLLAADPPLARAAISAHAIEAPTAVNDTAVAALYADFGALPPEINSGRMYAGPGAASMLHAAAAWDKLADELYSTAASYGSTVSNLTGEGWLGPTSASMATTATAYVRWMTATAGLCEQAATHTRAATAAYETAFAMTVPPTVIAANRSQLSSLVATNTLGQHAPSIAAIEASYGEMWAQDATAMYGYADESAVASRLAPFGPLPLITGAAGPASQTAGPVSQTGGFHVAGADARTTLVQLTSELPEALEALASPRSSWSGLSRLLIGNWARAMSSLQPVSAFSRPTRWPEIDASGGRTASLGALSVPQTWVKAARASRKERAQCRLQITE